MGAGGAAEDARAGRPGRSLTTLDAAVMVVGLVLGVGIFRAPQLVAANSPTLAAFFLLWVLGGLLSFIGALCYAELATTYPDSGGEYHFVSRALGPGVGFLFAWARLTVLQTGSVALLAYVFADYAAPLFGWGGGATPWLAAGAVVALTALNVLGLRPSRFAQYALTAVEVLGLLVVVSAILLLPGRAGPVAPQPHPASANLAMGMVFVLLTYGGWSEAAYLSAEIRDQRRGIGRALFAGIAIITALYLMANAAYAAGLGLAGISRSSMVAADLMRSAAGPAGAALVSGIVMVSALSSANACIITGARSNFAVGRACGWLSFLAAWPERQATPTNGVLVQGALALVLVAFGALFRSGFEAMVAYTAPVFWLILLSTGISLFVLRRREGAVPRPFRVPLYPVTPALFCAASAFMLYASIAYAGPGAALGLLVMTVAIPIFVLGRSRPKPGVAV
jgi:amino acid transporter